MKKINPFCIAIILLIFIISCKDKTSDTYETANYIWPTEQEVLENINKWQNIKFGMLIHWGLYSELGVVESWSICSEEADWIPRDSTVAYNSYKRNYWDAINTFNPVNFNPESWAKLGKNAGMKYIVFSTKHHDGFCMFDTKQTNFSIANGAFKNDPRRNIAKEVFEAFRKEGYMIGADFSKPDWHCQYYWWDRYSTPSRNNNYDINNNKWRWDKFKEFTYKQIEEIVSGEYGTIDILWLDGGWVCPPNQDIDIPKIAKMSRKYNPEMIIVDRTVHGLYENYFTPERKIPKEQLNYPWESCIPLGNDWGHVPNDVYKSSTEIIHNLVEIIAKGGNMLLGIGPKADGTFSDDVIEKLHEIGNWISINGEAIYNSRTTKIYKDGNTWFTKSKNEELMYAITLINDSISIPEKIIWKANEPLKNTEIILLQTGMPVKWTKTSKGIEVTIPKTINAKSALAFSYKIN